MNFRKLEIPEIILLEPKVFYDSRGYFVEVFRQEKINEHLGYSVKFCQQNESLSSYGVLRGLHYQLSPYEQTKLINVIYGSILDVVVDLRKDSKTFGHHLTINLSADNRKLLLIPKGFAHGFVVLSDKALISYMSDNYYNPKLERGIAYNDKSLGINWQISKNDIKLSEKDSNLPFFQNAEFFESSNDFYE